MAHLDLIQETAAPTWSELRQRFPYEAATLLAEGVTFLRWQLVTFPLRAIICNGKAPLRQLCALLDQPTDV